MAWGSHQHGRNHTSGAALPPHMPKTSIFIAVPYTIHWPDKRCGDVTEKFKAKSKTEVEGAKSAVRAAKAKENSDLKFVHTGTYDSCSNECSIIIAYIDYVMHIHYVCDTQGAPCPRVILAIVLTDWS